MKVKDKVIAVTGAGSGIGRELTLELIKRGAKVAAIDLNEDGLNGTEGLLAENMRKRISLHVMNITDRDAVADLPNAIVEQFGHVDGIINNAGIIQPFVRINDLELAAIDRVMNVNFYGALYMCKTFLPHLLQRPTAHIVNISSMGGFLPVPGQSIYGASKAAVKLMTEGLYAELLNTNVKVTVVFPGATDTNIMKNSGLKTDMDTMSAKHSNKLTPLPASEAARIIIHGIEKDRPRVFVGNDSKLMDILYRLAPEFATRLISKQMQMLLE
ncbi:MAG: SDR family NAD(P)-dependent oxidoreductase [Flavobacteriales bacterium]|nr:SDR family NAD(P)-dependent oxidoreductase [Flavobacteriales bacterium]